MLLDDDSSSFEQTSNDNLRHFHQTFTRPLGSVGRAARLESCHELENWLQAGQFAFVIGPGCARIGWNEPDVTMAVATQMAHLFRNRSSLDEADRDYLGSLALQMSIDLTLVPVTSKSTEIERVLEPARAALIRLARVSMEAVTSSLRRWHAPVVDWSRLTVPLAGDRRRRVLAAMDDAIDRLATLGEHSTAQLQQGDSRPEPIREDWEDFRLVFGLESITASLTAMRGDLDGSRAELAGTHLAWFTNLVWHSFRYAAPWPPSTDEIAFQLGVSGEQVSQSEVPSRAHATQPRASQTQSAQILRRIYEIALRETSPTAWSARKRFYRSVAELVLEPRPPNGELPEVDPFGSTTNDAGLVLGDRAYPVVFSSGFDDLVERAILEAIAGRADGRDNRVGLNVVFPVVVHKDLLGNGEIRWVIVSRQVGETPTWRFIKDKLVPGTEGPIVVKLNGDPNGLIGAEPVDGGSMGRVEPMVVLTEFQHLSLLMIETRLFHMLAEAQSLPPDGSFILMGESVDEWTIRQRLFGQTMRSVWLSLPQRANKEDDGVPKLARAISINRRAHHVRHSLFAWVNIKEYEAELTEVSRRLESIREAIYS
jgi:hypothetical protein